MAEEGGMIPVEKRRPILDALQDAKEKGLSYERGCAALDLCPRTVERWRNPLERSERRPMRTFNALMPWEIDLVKTLIRQASFADYSVRELSIAALEEYGIYVSPVTFWQYQKKANCNGPRRGIRQPRGRGNKPDVSWVTGPNQVWSWDITHLPTGRAWEYWYLYALEDVFSRKVVAWLITDSLLSEEVRSLWDQGLINENLLIKPQTEWPVSLSDRGTQMRSHSTARYFMRLGVAQLFARPRTPNDNPNIEALFSVVKTEPEYPGAFPTIRDAVAYFSKFFDWYNNVHLHTSLKMLPPSQVHSGNGEEILEERRKLSEQTIERRRQYFENGMESRPDDITDFIGHRNLRFKFSRSSIAPDSPQNMRQLLIN